MALIGNWMLRTAAAIHATSSLEADETAAQFPSQRLVTIPLGVEPMPIANGCHTAKRAGDAITILFLGRLVPIKNLELMLRAIALARSSKAIPLNVTVAGAGSPEYERALRGLVGRLGLTSCVEFVGFADQTRKWELIAASDLMILPSVHENFGISAVEGMAAGLVVIVSKHVGIAGFLRENDAGMVTDLTEASLAACIMRAAEDAELRARMGRNAAEFVRESLSWDVAANRLISLYATLLAR